MVAQMSHPNIVTVIDRGEDDGQQYIVFELVDGENLKQLVERTGPLPVRRAVELGARDRRRARVRARARARAPRREAAERAADAGRRGEGDRLRDRALARRRARRHADGHGARHEQLPLAGAGERQAGHAGDRRLLARRRALRAADRGGAVPGRELRRRRDEARQRAGARHPRRSGPTSRCASSRRSSARSRRTLRAASARWTSSRGSCGSALPSSAAVDAERTFIAPSPVLRESRPQPRAHEAAPLAALSSLLAAARRRGDRRRRARARRLERQARRARGAAATGAAVAAARASARTTRDGGDGEHDADAPKATDDNPTTYWDTEHYNTFSKRGVGVVLDAGRAVKLASDHRDERHARLHRVDPRRQLAERPVRHRLRLADGQRHDDVLAARRDGALLRRLDHDARPEPVGEINEVRAR